MEFGARVPPVSVETPPPRSQASWERILFGRHPRRALLRILVVTLLVFVMFRFFVVPIRVDGQSMEPTYQNGSINLVNRMSYSRKPPQRGDIVAVEVDNGTALVLKRIVGLPGERVAIRRGRVYVNGKALVEPYARSLVRGIVMGQPLLGTNEFFVIGDNRAISIFGQVPRENIIGKVIF